MTCVFSIGGFGLNPTPFDGTLAKIDNEEIARTQMKTLSRTTTKIRHCNKPFTPFLVERPYALPNSIS
jgi:biotin synthase-related radical SAM superfamily protein